MYAFERVLLVKESKGTIVSNAKERKFVLKNSYNLLMREKKRSNEKNLFLFNYVPRLFLF